MSHKHMPVIVPVKHPLWFGLSFTLYRTECEGCDHKGKDRWWKATALNDADAMEASDDEQ